MENSIFELLIGKRDNSDASGIYNFRLLKLTKLFNYMHNFLRGNYEVYCGSRFHTEINPDNAFFNPKFSLSSNTSFSSLIRFLSTLYHYCNRNNYILDYYIHDESGLVNVVIYKCDELEDHDNQSSFDAICNILTMMSGIYSKDLLSIMNNTASFFEENKVKIIMKCNDCKKEIDDGKKLYTYDDETNYKITKQLCSSCFSNYKHCDICQYFDNKEKIVRYISLENKKFNVCRECIKNVVNCENCEKIELLRLTKQTIKINNNGKEELLKTCNKCVSLLKYNDCQNCGSKYNTKIYNKCPCRYPKTFKRMINGYTYNVLDSYSADIGDELFGIEIESGTLNKNRIHYEEICSNTNQLIEGDAVLKYDRSIDEKNTQTHEDNDYKGFEIVTRPLEYRNAIKFLKRLSKNRHPMLRSWEVKTAGIHIHVSKSAISKIECGKILLFVNDKVNKTFIQYIARRLEKRYAKLSKKKITDYKDMSHDRHYDAINTSKPHTIEFRIFRGSLKKETLLSYLQFVKSLIEFVRITNVEKLHWKNYITWLLSYGSNSTFKELKDYVSKFERKTNDEGDNEI